MASERYVVGRIVRLSDKPSGDAVRTVDAMRAESAYEAGRRAGLEEAAKDICGVENPWPLADVLEHLARAVKHLADQHDCDCHGWEQDAAATEAAIAYARAIRKRIGEDRADQAESNRG